MSHLGVGCEEVQGRDAEPEFLRLGELSKAGAQGHQAVPGDARSHLQQLLTEKRAELEWLQGPGPGPGPPHPRPAAVLSASPRPRSPQVVDAVAVQAEAVGAIGPVHQQLDVLTDAAETKAREPSSGPGPLLPRLARSPLRGPLPFTVPVPGPSLSSQLLEDRPRLRLRQRPHRPMRCTRGDSP